MAEIRAPAIPAGAVPPTRISLSDTLYRPRESGCGRGNRQPGQVRKEAAV